MERMQPHDLDAERGLLGSLMIDGRMTGEVLPLLDGDSFYHADHQRVYDTITKLYECNIPVDVVLLREELVKRGAGGNVVELDFLNSLTDAVPSAANAVYYAKIVNEHACRRALIGVGREITLGGYRLDEPVDDLLNYAEVSVFALSERKGLTDAVPVSELVDEALAMTEPQAAQEAGLATGFIDLDGMTGGLQPSQLIIVAGRPSMGKTTLACNIIAHVAMTVGRPVGLFSLETSKEQIARNLLCSHARMDTGKFKRGYLSDEDRSILAEAAEDLRAAPIFIDDGATLSLRDFKAKARRLRRRQGVELIVVDYLQLMSAKVARGEHRQQEVSTISRGLKAVAKELGIPVIGVAQLSRSVENREGNKPRLSDLRESGALEQDADLVLLLFREEYYRQDNRPGQADVIIAKQRNGPTGNVVLTFHDKYMRFDDYHGESND